MFAADQPVPSSAAAKQALTASLPRMNEEMRRINGLLASGHRHEAIEQFYALVATAIRTQRQDLDGKGLLVRGRTVDISVYRIPAQPRPEKPIALFLPGLLAALPLTAVRALAFVDLFDIVLCELPGHGASGEMGEVSLEAFAAEYAAVIDTALKRASGLLVIGESLGGLVALALARLRPGQIRKVILIDTPFRLTSPELAAWISQAWRNFGRRPYVRRICMEIMGFDPENGQISPTRSLYEMARDAPFGCVHIVGGDERSAGIASVVDDADIAALCAVNPAILVTPRVSGTGHAVLLDNPAGACAALAALIVNRVS